MDGRATFDLYTDAIALAKMLAMHPQRSTMAPAFDQLNGFNEVGSVVNTDGWAV